MHKLIKENKKELLIITILLVFIISALILIFSFKTEKSDKEIAIEEEKIIRSLPTSLDIENHQEGMPYYIEAEFLTESELSELNINTNTKAQILRRDPLIYKIINSDDDIVEDLSIYFKPIE